MTPWAATSPKRSHLSATNIFTFSSSDVALHLFSTARGTKCRYPTQLITQCIDMRTVTDRRQGQPFNIRSINQCTTFISDKRSGAPLSTIWLENWQGAFPFLTPQWSIVAQSSFIGPDWTSQESGAPSSDAMQVSCACRGLKT